MLLALVAIAAAALQPVLAGVYCTGPTGSTSAIGGQTLNVTWADDGDTPVLADVGPCSVDIYTGSVNAQTWLQNLAASVDVSKTASIMTTIDPSIGQDGAYYFVRFTSLALKDTTNPQYPYEAFSAKFTITNLSGSFNSTVLAEISAGASSGLPSSVRSSCSCPKAAYFILTSRPPSRPA